MYQIGSIKVNVEEVENSNYKLLLLFNGNSMSIFFGKNFSSDLNDIVSETIGSEHWMSELSDFFRFDRNGNLNSIILNVPTENDSIDYVHINSSTTYTLRLVENPGFCIVEQTKIRTFNLSSKILISTMSTSSINDSEIVMLNSDFGLIFNKKKYIGHLLSNPLKYLTDSSGEIYLEEPTESEYTIFNTYLKIVSDNNLRKKNDSMEIVVKQLSKEIMPKLDCYNVNKRLLIMKQEIRELIDFWE